MSYSWTEVFRMKTGFELTSSEAELWMKALQHDLDHNPPTDNEIKQAINWAFSMEHVKDFKKKFRSDYSETVLRMWICMWRKEPVGGEVVSNCQHCKNDPDDPKAQASGWITEYHTILESGKKHIVGMSIKPDVFTVAIPCTCAKGQLYLRKYSHAQQESIRRRQNRVIACMEEDRARDLAERTETTGGPCRNKQKRG